MKETSRTLLGLLLLAAPVAGQAQFYYSENPNVGFTNNTITLTITGYYGPDGAVSIPTTIGGWAVTGIGEDAFLEEIGVTNITIPASVTSIGASAFSASGLTDVMIPGNVTSIGPEAFSDCASLASVILANGVTSIGDGAFSLCVSLTSVAIPASVTRIGASAFSDCNDLNSVTIPGNVTSIGEYAFYSCPFFNSVYFRGDAPTADSTVFSYNGNPTVYYLPGTTGWSSTFGGCPTALWRLPYPVILNNGPNFGAQNNTFGFTISWATNVSLVVEASTNLAGPFWTPLQTNTLTNGSFYFSEPLQTNSSGRFYRVTSP